MYDRRRLFTLSQLAGLAGLGLLAALSAWLAELTTPPLVAVASPLLHQSDYYAENFTIVTLDAAGHIRQRLQGNRLDHYPDDDKAQLTNPRLTLYREQTVTWWIQSDQGEVRAKGESVWLPGPVIVRRPPELDSWELDGSAVLIYPRDEYAETQAPVQIRHPQLIVNAVGIRASLKVGRIELLSQVKSRYEPRHP